LRTISQTEIEHIAETLTEAEAEVLRELRKWRAGHHTNHMSVLFLPSYSLCSTIWESEPNPAPWKDPNADAS